ncbi:MAG: hypothetical protein HY420_03940 [Candidatus Kerfeldbacteria bacterium]|nr:hypothetical protein [Candidatus Kerfeldbacteria bacterium]
MAVSPKRVGLIVGFILVTIGLGFAIYFVFFRDLFGPVPTNRNIGLPGVFPTVNENRNVTVVNANASAVLPNINGAPPGPRPVADGGLTRTVPVVSTIDNGATLARNGRDLIYYDPTTGQFFQISPDGRIKTLLSPDAYPDVQKITWSPLKDKAIIEFPDQSKFLYDFRKKQQYTLAPEMQDISFAPSADRIAFKFIGDDPDDRFLVIGNADGTSSRVLEPLANKPDQFSPDWSPAGNVVGTFVESIDATRQRVVPIGQLGENFADFTVPGRGFQSSWSPGGDKILYSVFTKESAYNPQLYIADGRTENLGSANTSLDLQTWPSKCSFNGSGSALFCGVPQYLDQGSALFPETAAAVPDDFYRIDLVTGEKRLIARPISDSGNTSFTASQLSVSSDDSLLYFYDQQSKQVQRIQLR